MGPRHVEMESAWNVGVVGGTNRERFSERKVGSDQAWLLRPFVGIREWVPGLGESLVPFHIHATSFLMLPGVPGG